MAISLIFDRLMPLRASPQNTCKIPIHFYTTMAKHLMSYTSMLLWASPQNTCRAFGSLFLLIFKPIYGDTP